MVAAHKALASIAEYAQALGDGKSFAQAMQIIGNAENEQSIKNNPAQGRTV